MITLKPKRTYFNRGIFYGSCESSFFWIRIKRLGIGFSIKDSTLHPLLFSQRNGFQKYLKVGKWIIAYLPKN